MHEGRERASRLDPIGWRIHFPLRPFAQEKASSSLAQSCMSPPTKTPPKPSMIPNEPKDMIDEASRPGDTCSKRPSPLAKKRRIGPEDSLSEALMGPIGSTGGSGISLSSSLHHSSFLST